MRIVFVLTYPIYHSLADVDAWLAWDSRDRRMPALLAGLGPDVELWGIARQPVDRLIDPPALPPGPAGETAAPVRLRGFRPDNPTAATRAHVSADMVAAARAEPADLYVLIGTNGGAGFDLHDKALAPLSLRYAVIIGGDYWSRLIPGAALVLPEAEVQCRRLAHPFPRIWRRSVPADRMMMLPKSIDTRRFTPAAAAADTILDQDYDVIAVSRLSGWKSFDAVGELSRDLRVAVAGGGERADELHRKYPRVDWLGHVPHAELPALLRRSRLYFHAGRRDYHPRAIVEAMACGLPVAALDDRIGPDVLPPDCGLLLDPRNFVPKVRALLADEPRRAAMGQAARRHAAAKHGLFSSLPACRRLIELAQL